MVPGRSRGFGRIDVRFHMTTHDGGANIYCQYCGVRENDATMGAIGTGAATEFEGHYQTLFVGKGHALPGLLVEDDVYRVT